MSQKTGRSHKMITLMKSYRAESSVTDASIMNYLSSFSSSPRALSVALLYQYGEHQQLLDLKTDPLHYNDAFRFRDDYTCTEFLSKSSFLKVDIDRKKVAFDKFLLMEDKCKQTNARFRNLSLDPSYHGSNVWLLNAVTRKIERILGAFSPDEFVDDSNWGPGVSTLLKGEEVSAFNKFHAERGITRSLYSLVSDWFPIAYPLWAAQLSRENEANWADYQEGNVIVTVPKNSKTDRVIAVEPGLNLWFQKGIGSMIRKRLLRHGINLRDQTINQRLSKKGSLDPSLSTVDFSSASDTISRELIREILPPKWFQIMDLCRSHYGKLDSSSLKWEKFSSMGNGFTFELESLIFYAAASAVAEYAAAEGQISVYGDDVIIPTSCFELFSEFSNFLGFTVNPKKSFSSSYFRESCGDHWFRGIDCKPIYLKDRIRDVQSVFKLANSIRSLAHRRNSYYGCDHELLNCWKHLYSRVPKPLRLKVPISSGASSGFISNFDEACPIKARNGIEGYHYLALRDVGITRETDQPALLLTRLWSMSERDYRNTYGLRGRTKLKMVSSLVSQWYNLGAWV